MTEPLVPPPNDVPTEKALLGAILLGGAVGLRALDAALELLRPESFYSGANQHIFSAIVSLREKGITIDVLSVSSCLRDRDRLAQVGGGEYFASLAETGWLQVSFERAAQRLAELHRLRVFIDTARALTAQAYAAQQDVSSFLAHAETTIRDVVSAGEKRSGEFVEVVVKRVLSEAAKAMASPGRIVGMPTGTDGFDRRTAGLRGKTVTILAGRPGMGKSAQALNWALHMARTTGAVIPFFSCEMSNDEQGTRTIASETNVPMGVLVTGNITSEIFGSLLAYPQTIKGVPLVFFDEADITVQGIGAKVRRLMADAARDGKKVGAVFIDYLQLVKASKRNQSREGDVAEVSRSLKLLAKALDLPFIVLAQLNREGEKGTKPEKPKLSHLRESGAIENDADIIVFIHREGYYDTRIPDDTAELIIAKGRNIAKGTVKVRFDGKHTRFGRYEIGRDEQEDSGT